MSALVSTLTPLYEKSAAVPIGVETKYKAGSSFGNFICKSFFKILNSSIDVNCVIHEVHIVS